MLYPKTLLLTGVCHILGQLSRPLTSMISNHVAQFPLSRAFEMVLKSPFSSFQGTVKMTLGTEWISLVCPFLGHYLLDPRSWFGEFPVRFCLPSSHSADLLPAVQRDAVGASLFLADPSRRQSRSPSASPPSPVMTREGPALIRGGGLRNRVQVEVLASTSGLPGKNSAVFRKTGHSLPGVKTFIVSF